MHFSYIFPTLRKIHIAQAKSVQTLRLFFSTFGLAPCRQGRPLEGGCGRCGHTGPPKVMGPVQMQDAVVKVISLYPFTPS
jgi:hypothetical protein